MCIDENGLQQVHHAYTASFRVEVLPEDVPHDAPSNILMDYPQEECGLGLDERTAKLLLADRMRATLRKFGYEPDLTDFLA